MNKQSLVQSMHNACQAMSSCSMELITCMELAVKLPVDGSFKHFISIKLKVFLHDLGTQCSWHYQANKPTRALAKLIVSVITSFSHMIKYWVGCTL